MAGNPNLVEFRINDRSYGVDIDLVKEILMTWTIVPDQIAREEISGVISFRGNDIPVINIRHLLGVSEPASIHGQRMIIIGLTTAMKRSFGFLVDSVCHVIEITDRHPDGMGPAVTGTSSPYVKGIVTGRIQRDGEHPRAADEQESPPVIWLDSDSLIYGTIMG